MKQMNSRNPQAAQANPQMQQMQKFFPIIFGVIYIRVPLGAIIYMVVSSAMRIGTQDIMFRTGMVTPVGAIAEREIGGATPEGKDTGSPKPKAIGTGGAKPAPGAAKTPNKSTSAAKRAAATGNGKPAGTAKSGTNGRAPTNGKRPANGKSPAPPRARTNGNGNGNKASNQDDVEPVAVPKEHPRSRSKRTRKAR